MAIPSSTSQFDLTQLVLLCFFSFFAFQFFNSFDLILPKLSGNSQLKNAALVESDDDVSSVSSSSTMRSDRMLVSDEVDLDKDVLLDQAVDALYEKRGSTREKALSAIIEALNNESHNQFVEKKFATLLHQCLNCMKRGSSREIALASHLIGLLALTVGSGDNVREILEESVPIIVQAMKSRSDAIKMSSLLECLAIITFVGGVEEEQTETSMHIMWQVIHPKLGSNVAAAKPSATVTAAVVSAWAFLLTTRHGVKLNPKPWQDSISYLSSLLDKEDRSVRIAAGEALALIFEIGHTERSSADTQEESKPQDSYIHLQGLKSRIVNQVKDLSAEAGGKGSAKKDLTTQRNLFGDVLDFFEGGYCPEISIKIGGDSLQTSSWSEMIQLNFLKKFLAGGFVKHMQENEFLHDVFGFTPTKKFISDNEHKISAAEKRMFRSPNSFLNKARTQFRNKQRMLSEGNNIGHYSVTVCNEEV